MTAFGALDSLEVEYLRMLALVDVREEVEGRMLLDPLS